MQITEASHLDHGLTEAHLTWLRERFADRTAFFIETVELPDTLPALSCGLYGPLVGDAPIQDDEVVLGTRGERAWPSRLLDRPSRPSRLLTVIAGPHENAPCVLYTAYGGPCAPREPGDPSLNDEERAQAAAFWAEHALAR